MFTVATSTKNERSCICAAHNRVPNRLVTMYYNNVTDKYDVVDNTVVNGEVTIRGVKHVFPEGSGHYQIAYDTLGEYVRTWYKDGKGYIDYMDNLQATRVTKEIECTSISCGINTVNTYINHRTEVLVIYTLADGSVMELEQSGRFQTPNKVGTVKGSNPQIRVCGPTSSNRFLIRDRKSVV